MKRRLTTSVGLALVALFLIRWKSRETREPAAVPGPSADGPVQLGDAESGRKPDAAESRSGAADLHGPLLPDARINVAGERERVAAYKQRKTQERDERETRANAHLGAPFTSGSGKMTPLNGLEAVDVASADTGTVYRKIGRWVIRDKAEPDTDDTRLTHYDPAQPPVVRNEETGRIGLATGQFVVRYKDGTDPRSVAALHDLALESVSEGAHRAFLNARAGQDLLALLAALRGDPSLEEAELDVVYDRVRAK